MAGPITPPSSKGHRYILVITDYFSKWSEAIALKEVNDFDMVKLIKNYITYRFGVPQKIVRTNGPQFVSQVFYSLCDKFKIKIVASTACNLATNGQAEAFNKVIIKTLKKLVKKNNQYWNEKLGVYLWAYNTTIHTPKNATPFSFVYDCKATLPFQIQLPSLHKILALEVTTEDNNKLHF